MKLTESFQSKSEIFHLTLTIFENDGERNQNKIQK